MRYRLSKLYRWRVVIACIGSYFFFDMFLHLNILSSTVDPIQQQHHLIRYFRNFSDKVHPANKKHRLEMMDYNREKFLYDDRSSQNFEKLKQNAKSKWVIAVLSQTRRFKRRFINSHGKQALDPFKFCSVKNCEISTEEDSYEKADAVFFNMHRFKGMSDFPPRRYQHQRYIMFTDESPVHTFYIAKRAKMRDFNGMFNWTMTYSISSDIPVPYGRTIKLAPGMLKRLTFSWLKKKTNITAIVSSNCKPEPRQSYLKELSKYATIHVFGKCGQLKCSGNAFSNHDCKILHRYKFYLAFENSLCVEYITEKVWWNAFHHNAIPIVMGALKSDYKRLLPPKSFIHVEDFKSVQDLAKYIDYLDKNMTAYKEYFQWHATHKVLNEHGYYGTPALHICRICERLNSANLAQKKVYDDLGSHWDKRKLCQWTKRIGGL